MIRHKIRFKMFVMEYGGRVVRFIRNAARRRRKNTKMQKRVHSTKWEGNTLFLCQFENLWYYVKTNIVRAPLEALLTLYLAEAWMIFTERFTHKMADASQTVYMIFFPLAVATAVCFVYSLGASLAVGIWAYFVQKNYRTNAPPLAKEQLEDLYLKIDGSFAFVMRVIHIVGALCYGCLAYFIAINFKYNIYANIPDMNNKFTLYIFVFGLVAGALWNFYGYHSDRRIDWSKVFIFLKDTSISTSECIRELKLHYFKYALLLHLVCCTAIISFTIYLMIDFRFSLFENMKSLDELLSYSAFITLFISVASLYGKQMYYIFYTRRYKQSEIFPRLVELSPRMQQ